MMTAAEIEAVVRSVLQRVLAGETAPSSLPSLAQSSDGATVLPPLARSSGEGPGVRVISAPSRSTRLYSPLPRSLQASTESPRFVSVRKPSLLQPLKTSCEPKRSPWFEAPPTTTKPLRLPSARPALHSRTSIRVNHKQSSSPVKHFGIRHFATRCVLSAPSLPFQARTTRPHCEPSRPGFATATKLPS